MNPIILDGPAVEPVSLAEMRLFLRLDATDEDDLVTALIVASRVMVEAATRLALVRQSWRWRVTQAACRTTFPLPLAPVVSLDAVRQVGGAALADGFVRLDLAADPARLVLLDGAAVPEAGIEVDFTIGFGPDAAAVPAPLRLAIRMLAARFYERRGDERAPEEPLPASVRALVAPFVRARLA